MEYTKKWYCSKGILLGIITTLIGITDVIHTMVSVGDFTSVSIVMTALGILKVIERTLSDGDSIVM